MQQARTALLERGAMQQRIHSLFLSLSPLSLMRHSFPGFPPLLSDKQEEKNSHPQLFYLAGDRLYFVYHHPIDPHSDFCGPLLGTLTLRKNTLYLISQREIHTEQREEPLCSQVHGVKFAIIYQDPQGGYVESTMGEVPSAHTFPRAIKMTIEHLSQKIVQFIFWLPTPTTPITYQGEL